LSEIVAGSAAQRAGLRPGDRILKFGDTPLSSSDDLVAAVWPAPQRVEVSVLRRGASAPESVAVELGGSPVRVGMAWRDSDAEPGAVYVVQIVPGTPAHRAGIAHGDRIYRLGGQPIGGSQQLLAELGRASGAVELEIEHRGRVRTVVLQGIPSPDPQDR
ncbi:MAG: PDZ domain-containing protein, partial [Pirellulales bacterium]